MISNKSVDFGGATGQLCYIEQQTDTDPVIFGWLILAVGQKDFLVFSINTLPEHFARLRPLFESSFATISLRTAGAITAERKNKLDAGRDFLASLSPQLLREQVGVSQWFRIYQPGKTNQPETERGYS